MSCWASLTPPHPPPPRGTQINNYYFKIPTITKQNLHPPPSPPAYGRYVDENKSTSVSAPDGDRNNNKSITFPFPENRPLPRWKFRTLLPPRPRRRDTCQFLSKYVNFKRTGVPRPTPTRSASEWTISPNTSQYIPVSWRQIPLFDVKVARRYLPFCHFSRSSNAYCRRLQHDTNLKFSSIKAWTFFYCQN